MGRKRVSSGQRKAKGKRKKEFQEESNNVENDIWQESSFRKETELGNKEELNDAGISDGAVVHDDAKLDKLSEGIKAMMSQLEEKINAGFKSVREEIEARFKAVRDEMAERPARKDKKKVSVPKSSKATARFTSIPVQVHTPELEALLKEVTKSTSSEDNSKTKTSSNSEDSSPSSSKKFNEEASSSEEVHEVTMIAPRSLAATKKWRKGPAPTRRSSRIAGR